MFATIMASLKFATINVGGMHDPVKRAYIFQHLLADGVDIVRSPGNPLLQLCATGLGGSVGGF